MGEEQLCNIDRLSVQQWENRFLSEYRLRKPVILEGWQPEPIADLQRKTQQDQLLRNFGHVPVLTGSLWELTTRGVKSARNVMPLGQYMSAEATDAEHPYLFDSGGLMQATDYDSIWVVPPVIQELKQFRTGSSRSSKPLLTFTLGSKDQGLGFHMHEDSFIQRTPSWFQTLGNLWAWATVQLQQHGDLG